MKPLIVLLDNALNGSILRFRRRRLLRSILIGLSCVASASGASAAPLALTISDSFSEQHFLHRNLLFPFIEQVRRELPAGAVMTFHRASGPLADAGMLERVRRGSIDIGLVTPALYPQDFPLTAVAELPGWSGSSCQLMIATERLLRPGSAVEREYRSRGIRPLMTVLLSHYPIVLAARHAPTTSAGLAALKLRTINHAMDLTVETVGGKPVRVEPDQTTAALAEGKIDGGLIPTRTVELYNMQNWVRSGTERSDFGSVLLSYAMSESRWRALPKRAQRALMRAATTTIRKGCASLDREALDSRARLAARGVEFVKLSPTDDVKLDRLFRKARERWSTEPYQRGLRGRRVLLEFQQLVTLAGGQPSK